MNLQAELGVVQQQMDDEKQKGAEKDLSRITALEQQEAQLLEQIMNAQVESNHETRMQESVSVIVQELENFEIDGLTLRQMCTSEDDYQLLRIRFQQIVEDKDDAWSRKIKGYEEREIQLSGQNKYLQLVMDTADAENTQLNNDIMSLKNDNLTLKAEKEDSDSKRDAAVREADGLRAELEQLKSWNDDLRNQVALGVGGAMRIVDEAEIARRKADELERVERIKAQRTIYDLVPDNSINPKNFTAKRATDGEEITFNWTQKNSYIVLDDPAQVEQFRLEHQAQNTFPDLSLVQPVEVIPPAIEDVTQGQFRDSAETMDQSAESANVGAGQADESVGLGHDTQVLAAKVATLEQTVDTLASEVEALKRKAWAA